DGVALHALWLKAPSSRGVLLFWHGNVGSNRRCLRQADQMTGLGYDIFMPDYRGYGKSGGQMEDQDQMYADAQAVYDWLLTNYEADQIVIVGYSLGTGVATYLAQENSPQRLVLVAPYRSMVAMKNLILPVAPALLLKYKLRNDRQLPNSSCPVLIVHGTGDELIPPRHSEYLHRLIPERSELFLLPNVSHRGVIFSGKLRQELARTLR
ncbi:MAG: alpha/beta fold hydrolase, partial [Bacteroidota bacterium]